jgi:hypothetical protein
LFEQCQPGRMLYADRWKILSLIQSEFLLATTVLCFNLDDDTKNGRVGTSALCSEEAQRRSVGALRVSRGIWEQQQAFSMDAKTAVRAISFVLSKFETDPGLISSSSSNNGEFGGATPATDTPETDNGISVGEPTLPISTFDESWMTIPSASGFQQSVPQDLSIDNMVFDDGALGDFFEMDQSWETWLQFE